jgi:hypothetical protein
MLTRSPATQAEVSRLAVNGLEVVHHRWTPFNDAQFGKINQPFCAASSTALPQHTRLKKKPNVSVWGKTVSNVFAFCLIIVPTKTKCVGVSQKIQTRLRSVVSVHTG